MKLNNIKEANTAKVIPIPKKVFLKACAKALTASEDEDESKNNKVEVYLSFPKPDE